MVAQPTDKDLVLAVELERELGLNVGSLRQSAAAGRIYGVKQKVANVPGKGLMWYVDRNEVLVNVEEGRFTKKRSINYPKNRKSPRAVDTDLVADETEGDDDPLFELLDTLDATVRQIRRSIRSHDRLIRKETIQSLAESLIESSRPR